MAKKIAIFASVCVFGVTCLFGASACNKSGEKESEAASVRVTEEEWKAACENTAYGADYGATVPAYSCSFNCSTAYNYVQHNQSRTFEYRVSRMSGKLFYTGNSLYITYENSYYSNADDKESVAIEQYETYVICKTALHILRRNIRLLRIPSVKAQTAGKPTAELNTSRPFPGSRGLAYSNR